MDAKHTPMLMTALVADDLVARLEARQVSLYNLAKRRAEWHEKAAAEITRLRSIVSKDPKTVMIAFEDGDHQRLSRAASKAIDRAERAEAALAEAEVRIRRMEAALKSQRAWIDHWREDANHNLVPTGSSLDHAQDDIDAALIREPKS